MSQRTKKVPLKVNLDKLPKKKLDFEDEEETQRSKARIIGRIWR
jgi:hypothetical protein